MGRRSYNINLAIVLDNVYSTLLLEYFSEREGTPIGALDILKEFPEIPYDIRRLQQVLYFLQKREWITIEKAQGKKSLYRLTPKARKYLPLEKPKEDKTTPDSSEVEWLYSLYPSATERGGKMMSTKKSGEDKERLKHLLEKYSFQELEKIISEYITEQSGKYLKNFSTFLDGISENEK